VLFISGTLSETSLNTKNFNHASNFMLKLDVGVTLVPLPDSHHQTSWSCLYFGNIAIYFMQNCQLFSCVYSLARDKEYRHLAGAVIGLRYVPCAALVPKTADALKEQN